MIPFWAGFLERAEKSFWHGSGRIEANLWKSFLTDLIQSVLIRVQGFALGALDQINIVTFETMAHARKHWRFR